MIENEGTWEGKYFKKPRKEKQVQKEKKENRYKIERNTNKRWEKIIRTYSIYIVQTVLVFIVIFTEYGDKVDDNSLDNATTVNDYNIYLRNIDNWKIIRTKIV